MIEMLKHKSKGFLVNNKRRLKNSSIIVLIEPKKRSSKICKKDIFNHPNESLITIIIVVKLLIKSMKIY